MISVITPTARGDEAIKLVEKSLKRQTFRDFEWIVEKKSPPREGYVWNFNFDMNNAIRKSKGDLIVSWQDWTYADPEALERFWTHYQEHPNYLVGAVGNKYTDETWTVETWRDPRMRLDQGTFYPCYFSDIEWNLASIPRKALYAVGGFDENLDRGFGMDGYSVNDRINLVGGYDFYLDQTIKSYALEHGRPPGWDELNWLPKYGEIHAGYISNPKLSYLS